LIPDWFSRVFQSDVKAFIAALGAHVAAKSWHAAVAYARIAAGLGGESFAVMPGQRDYAADKAWLVHHWGYSPQAWESFQRRMEGAFNAAFTRPVVYVVNKQDTNPATRRPISYDVAKQVINGGGGVGAECLRPAGMWNYGDWKAIDAYAASHHAYVQFQTCGPTTSASAEQGIISAAMRYHARSVEWYERTAVRPPSRTDMMTYQHWVNTHASG
jgi:hypothetical protein